jgi:hypothetical protein
MNNKIQYKDFFGLKEQATPIEISMKNNPGATKMAQDLSNKGTRVKLTTEEEIDEAQLLNHITDYKGGVEYVLVDPATAINVADEIKQFAAKKRIDIIKFKMSSSGTVGYFLFKLGEDAAKESQQIQGYISQKPEVKHFRFNVRHQKQSPEQSPEQSM